MLRWLVFILIYLSLGGYSFFALKTITKAKWVYYLYGLVALVILLNLIYQFMRPVELWSMTPGVNYAIGFFLVFFSYVIVVTPFLFFEDLIRTFISVLKKVMNYHQPLNISSRRKFISQIALGLASIPVASLLYGMVQGRYNFRVLSYVLYFDDLPESFDGYKITHFSDLHAGSLENRKKIEYAVQLINTQKSDVVLFTGDLINNLSEEMSPWQDCFSKIKARDGLYSVLGNHDYGDYTHWHNPEDKIKNFNQLIEVQKSMGFDLLMNDSRFIDRDSHRIAIVGVENWGKGFKQKGDLDIALRKVSESDFKIVMSHDPTHWTEKIIPHPQKIHLTLSGHTHGMQFGIEIPGLVKWSPVKWRYKHWAGIYHEAGHYLNVNRGFGVLAYPGRVGIWPEISVIELRKGKSPS